MDFQKKYPILQSPNDHVVIQWTRGYRLVQVLYKERLVTEVSSAGKLKKGIKIHDPELGIVDMKLSEKPIAIDLIIDGYHSPINVTYPTKELKSASTIFFVLAVISVLGAIYEGMSATMWYGALIGSIIIVIDVLSIIIYAVTGLLILNKQSWAFFLGGSWYSIFTLFYLLDLLLSGFYIDTFFVAALRIVVTIVLGYYLKHAVASVKHKKYEKRSGKSKEVIDDLP